VTVLLVIFLFPRAEVTAHVKHNADAARPTGTIDLGAAALRGWPWRQFLYVAAQTGVFSFFINYVVSTCPAERGAAPGLLPREWTIAKADGFQITERAASRLLSFGASGCSCSVVLRQLALSWFKAKKTLASSRPSTCWSWFGDGAARLDLGGRAFRQLLLHVDHVPHPFFALGIRGWVADQESLRLHLMAIVGGAIMPMLMGWLADVASMRVAFVCRCCVSPESLPTAGCGSVWPQRPRSHRPPRAQELELTRANEESARKGCHETHALLVTAPWRLRQAPCQRQTQAPYKIPGIRWPFLGHSSPPTSRWRCGTGARLSSGTGLAGRQWAMAPWFLVASCRNTLHFE